MILLEPLLRHRSFLTLAVEKLGLGGRVRVKRLCAKDYNETLDVVTCHAVAPLEKLLKWTTPVFFPGDGLLALRGAGAEEEVEAARRRLDKCGLTAQMLHVRAVPEIEGTRTIRIFTK